MDTEQVMMQERDGTDSNDARMEQILRNRVRERVESSRWNTNILILAYVNLTAAIIIALLRVDTLIIALVVISGLVTVWLLSWLRVKKLENKVYQQEIRNYAELLADQAGTAFNGAEVSGSATSIDSLLTAREFKVLRQMAEGKTNKEIAYTLQISSQTVKNHICHIFWKLDVNDRTSAVLLAIRKGWID